MREVVIGGMFAIVTALMSGWLVDGGIKRRTRRAIREEFELAKDLDDSWPETAALRDRAQRRLNRYVTPFGSRFLKLRGLQRLVAGLSIGVGTASAVAGTAALVIALTENNSSDVDPGAVAGVAAAVGASIGAFLVFAELGIVGLAERLAKVSESIARALVGGRLFDLTTKLVELEVKLPRRIVEGRKRGPKDPPSGASS